MDNNTEEQKDNQPSKSGVHLITVVDSTTGSNVRLKVCHDTPMEKVFQSFCGRMNRNISEVRFMYHSKRVNAGETAASLGLGDEAEFTATQMQLGG
uniref:Rad60/SUMO-like domain-containing protein n=1 Tax=Trichuris muris TaxID=70415 RepID=A0A5S6QPZ4_TRIMR